jgi:hypothetical protein
MNKFLLGLTGVAALFMASGASAALKLDVGGTVYSDSLVATPGADLNPDFDAITLFGGIPGFTGSITTGKGDAANSFPELLSLNFDMQTNGTKANGSTLTVMLTDTEVAGSYSTFAFSSSVNAGIKVEYSLYVGAAGNEFDLGTQVGSTTVGTIPAKDFSLESLASPTADPFSLTIVAKLHFTGGTGQSVKGSTLAQVPEPAVLSMFGLGLIGMGLARRRMKK